MPLQRGFLFCDGSAGRSVGAARVTARLGPGRASELSLGFRSLRGAQETADTQQRSPAHASGAAAPALKLASPPPASTMRERAAARQPVRVRRGRRNAGAERRLGASGPSVQASHGVPISTIPAQAGPGAESGLTGPGLRDLAEVLVTATARSPRPESVPAKTRRQPYSARCVRYGRAEKAQDGGANPGPADRGAGLHGGSVLRRLPGAGDIGGGSYRPRTVEETVAGRFVAHAGVAAPVNGI
jgi:hypothetical protein